MIVLHKSKVDGLKKLDLKSGVHFVRLFVLVYMTLSILENGIFLSAHFKILVRVGLEITISVQNFNFGLMGNFIQTLFTYPAV